MEKKSKPIITVYTPTYNRGYVLNRVYESLCRQSCKEFEWLVIDDGSTDNTQELVNEWIKEEVIPIKYIYKENGGVHTARDLAYQICKTELIVSCDSDDWLTEDAVELWLNCWKNRGEGNYIGIFSVAVNERGERVTGRFPDVKSATFQEFTYKLKCTGEKHTVLTTETIAAILPAPVFEGERLVGEGYKWIQLPENGQFLLLDKETRVYEQQDDGYMKSVSLSRFKNPNGFRALRKQLIISGKYFKPKFRGYSGYIAFSLILKDHSFIKNSPNPLVTLLMLPIGVAEYLYYVYKKGKK